MKPSTEKKSEQTGAERFDQSLRQQPDFAEAFERVEKLEKLVQQFGTPLKRVDTTTDGEWKPSRLAVHSPVPD
jgi:hypothetical protein